MKNQGNYIFFYIEKYYERSFLPCAQYVGRGQRVGFVRLGHNALAVTDITGASHPSQLNSRDA